MDYIPAKKSLGQNFLQSEGALEAIIATAEVSPDDIILEVGPGKGALTKRLLAKIGSGKGKVIAIEKDDRLIETLKKLFTKEIAEGTFVLIHRDVLEFDPKEVGLDEGSYKIVANIPYYITGVFLRKFLEESIQPSKMVLMVQKEVAQRIVAGERTKGKESILSVSVKVYGEPHYVQTVKAGSFVPAPTVDSAILLIKDISRNYFDPKISEKEFFDFIHRAFAHKRKQLAQNLDIPTEKREGFFQKLKISDKIRAEDVPMSDWKKIFLAVVKTSSKN